MGAPHSGRVSRPTVFVRAMPWHERWRNVFRQEQLDDKLDAELEYHLAETVDRLMERHGLTEREAYLEARKRLGNYGLHKEKTRDMNIAGWLDSARADLLYGLRQLRTNPGFTGIAVLSLALGIGANTAMFQLVNAIQLRTLPVENPQELVSVGFVKGSSRGGWWSSRSANFTTAQWDQIRTQQQAFQGMFAYSAGRFNLTPGYCVNGSWPHFQAASDCLPDYWRRLDFTAWSRIWWRGARMRSGFDWLWVRIG